MQENQDLRKDKSGEQGTILHQSIAVVLTSLLALCVTPELANTVVGQQTAREQLSTIREAVRSNPLNARLINNDGSYRLAQDYYYGKHTKYNNSGE